jgi:hypothetical protein
MAAMLSPPLPPIAAATATAAAISAATSTISAAIATAFWLIDVCPCAASALATVACPRRCRRWHRFLVDCCLPLRCLCFGHRCLPPPLPPLAVDAIATIAVAANRCPLLLLPQQRDVQNITFKVIF